MRTKLTCLTALFGAAAAAVGVLSAPVAGASVDSCAASKSPTLCHSPGNVQINDAPPPVNFDPYGGYGLALGGTGIFPGR
jgi:hypothetical protein